MVNYMIKNGNNMVNFLKNHELMIISVMKIYIFFKLVIKYLLNFNFKFNQFLPWY